MEGETNNNELLNLTTLEHLKHYLGLGMNLTDAIKQVAKERKVPKNEVYKIALELKK